MNIRFACAAVALASVAFSSRSEDLLVKKSGEYLGWKVEGSNDRFRTCSGGEIATAGGQVKPTQEKCRKKTFTFSGVVKAIDREKGEVTLRDSHGNSVTFTLRGADRDQLKNLTVGGVTTLSITPADDDEVQKPIIVTTKGGVPSSVGTTRTASVSANSDIDIGAFSQEASGRVATTSRHRRMTKD